MSNDSALTGCCAACFGLCCLSCCESIVVYLNFKKPGTRTGSTQRGCCRNLGESEEDDVFEKNARAERLAKSSKKDKKGKNRKGGNEGERAKENEEGGDKPVTDQQPGASPEMSATTSDTTAKT